MGPDDLEGFVWLADLNGYKLNISTSRACGGILNGTMHWSIPLIEFSNKERKNMITIILASCWMYRNFQLITCPCNMFIYASCPRNCQIVAQWFHIKIITTWESTTGNFQIKLLKCYNILITRFVTYYQNVKLIFKLQKTNVFVGKCKLSQVK